MIIGFDGVMGDPIAATTASLAEAEAATAQTAINRKHAKINFLLVVFTVDSPFFSCRISSKCLSSSDHRPKKWHKISVAGLTTRSLISLGDHVGMSVRCVNF